MSMEVQSSKAACGCHSDRAAQSQSAQPSCRAEFAAAPPPPAPSPRMSTTSSSVPTSGCASCRDDYAVVKPRTELPRIGPELSQDLIPASETAQAVQRMSSTPEPCHLEQAAPKFLSNDAFTPDNSPRTTQTSIGKVLVPDVGVQIPLDTHVGERVLNKWAEYDKASWVDKTGVDAPFLYCVMRKFPMKHSFDPFYSHRSPVAVFPRSKQCELRNIAARERAGVGLNDVTQLDCDCPQTDPCCRADMRKTLAKCRTPPWWHPVPCWWHGAASGRPLPVGDVDDYARIPIRDEDMIGHEPQNLMRILKLNRAERYTPGEIFCEDKKRLRGEQTYYYNRCRPHPGTVETAEGIAAEHATCEARQWSRGQGAPPQEPADVRARSQPTQTTSCDVCLDALGKQRRVTASARDRCVQLRNEEMRKVGLPFKSAACRWQHQMFPPQRLPVVGRTPMKEFPHTRLTNI